MSFAPSAAIPSDRPPTDPTREPPAGRAAGHRFVQMVDLHTSNPDAVTSLLERWRAETAQSTDGQGRPLSVLHDCDDSGHIVLLMQYPTQDAATQADAPTDYASDLALMLDDRPRILGFEPS